MGRLTVQVHSALILTPSPTPKSKQPLLQRQKGCTTDPLQPHRVSRTFLEEQHLSAGPLQGSACCVRASALPEASASPMPPTAETPSEAAVADSLTEESASRKTDEEVDVP